MALALRRAAGQSIAEHAHGTLPGSRNQLNASSLAQFVDRLPISEVIQPIGHRASPENASVQLPYYKIAMSALVRKVHRDLEPTRMWGSAASSPGPIFETRSGQGVLIEWINDLPEKHIFSVDHNIHGAERDKPEVRAVVHLHGAKAGPTIGQIATGIKTHGANARRVYFAISDSGAGCAQHETVGRIRGNAQVAGSVGRRVL